MWIKDPKTNKKSITLTLLVSGFSVALIKLLLAGMTIKGLTMGAFTGADFGLVIGSLGGIYAARKHTDKDKEK